jgi:hypothetical protein
MQLIYILLFIVGVNSQHTSSFLEYWNKFGNDNHYFYDSFTFGMDSTSPCMKISNNTEYRRFVNSQPCSGYWCIDNTFKCKGDNQNCYNVEHIIDKRVVGDNGNIYGNLVMAWGRWNQELGHLKYEDSEKEKEIVYGVERVDRAKNIIVQCNSNNNVTMNPC